VLKQNLTQLAWVYATTNIKIQIDIFCRIIAGYIWKGKVLANIWFFNFGYISGIKGLAFAQDLKLGIYCNVRLYLSIIVKIQTVDGPYRSLHVTFSLYSPSASSSAVLAKSPSSTGLSTISQISAPTKPPTASPAPFPASTSTPA
jgi:hypothetical protein